MFTRTVSKALLASAAAGLVTFAVAPAHAELNVPRSVAVPFGDLDLKTDVGQKRLMKRIAYAAETVCGPADTLSYHSRRLVAECRGETIASANQGLVEVFAQAGTTIRVAAN